MKIIVNSDKEKELLERFLAAFNDLEIAEDIEAKESGLYKEDRELEEDEYRFIENGFNNCIVEIGDTRPLETDDSIIIGVCSICGNETKGTFDGEDVTYDEYIDKMSDKAQKEWLCSECFERGKNNDKNSPAKKNNSR